MAVVSLVSLAQEGPLAQSCLQYRPALLAQAEPRAAIKPSAPKLGPLDRGFSSAPSGVTFVVNCLVNWRVNCMAPVKPRARAQHANGNVLNEPVAQLA